MRFFLTDLKRSLSERTFFASLIIAFITLFGAFIYLGLGGDNASFEMSQSLVFPFVAPFLAALPYSVMIMTEKSTKYRDLIRLRRKGKNYVFPRFLTVGISGGLSLLLPEMLLLAVTLVTSKSVISADIINILMLSFPFGFSYAALAFSLTFYNSEKILPLMIPEVFYLLLTYAFPYLNLEKYYPPLCISPFIFGSPDYKRIGVTLCGILLFAVVLTIIGKIKEASENV
jgi:hypothetical protein